MRWDCIIIDWLMFKFDLIFKKKYVFYFLDIIDGFFVWFFKWWRLLDELNIGYFLFCVDKIFCSV